MLIRHRLLRQALILLPLALATALLSAVPSASALDGTGSIDGVVYEDADRNQVQDPGEAPFAGRMLTLFDAAGAPITSAATDATGRFGFSGLAEGSYTVKFAPPDWQSLRDDWVPTTTASLYFEHAVSVAGPTAADFGLRRIVRSTSEPISAVTGTDGLRVESYNDAVSAQALYDVLHTGTLIGPEAGVTTVRFDLGNSNVTHSSWTGVEGAYSSYTATIDSDYLTWLDVGNKSLFHEYGHAWSLYHAILIQQTESLDRYLEARGVFGDPRVGTNVFWDPAEMIAEDYRQLFGSGPAITYPQANSEIPPASEVSGLADWLRFTFTQPAGPGPAPDPDPVPTPSVVFDVSAVAVTPTPVVGSASVTFVLSAPGAATVRILDGAGRPVRTLLSGEPEPSGSISVPWDGKDDRGRRLKSGTYVASVEATDAGASDYETVAFAVAGTSGNGGGRTK